MITGLSALEMQTLTDDIAAIPLSEGGRLEVIPLELSTGGCRAVIMYVGPDNVSRGNGGVDFGRDDKVVVRGVGIGREAIILAARMIFGPQIEIVA